MKILVAGSYPQGTVEKLRAQLPEHEIRTALTQDVFDTADYGDLALVRALNVTEDSLKGKSSLRAMIKWGAGYDSIDVQAAGRQGIAVANTPGVNAYAVAELAVTLMLTCGRAVALQNSLTHRGIWDRRQYSGQMTTLSRKTVGIIGGGNIGRRVAALVQAFGAEVIYYDAYRLPEEREAACRMRYVSLEELFRSSDVITVHVPLLDTTRHMIDGEAIGKMKRNVILINTARGGIIDDEALCRALQDGHVLAAGLDCVENEDLQTNPLAGLDSVILTPHIGGTSNDLAEEMVPAIAGMIREFERTGVLPHIVNAAYLRA